MKKGSSGNKKNTIPHSVRKSGGKTRAKNQRREEAQERQKIWDSLTLAEKIARILSSPGNSAKQKTKLGIYLFPNTRIPIRVVFI